MAEVNNVKSSKRNMIMLIIIFAIIFSGIGLFAGSYMASGNILPKFEERKLSINPETYFVDEFLINLADSDSKRYLKIEIYLSYDSNDEALFEEIKEKSLAYGISLVDNHRIDEINILQATYEAMRNALADAVKMANGKVPGMILVDHVHIPEVEISQMSITHGDAQSVSIASASILAKVSRDRLMKEYDEKYPQYAFAKHKGYGTKAHYEALAQYGPSEIHRMTFLKKLYS